MVRPCVTGREHACFDALQALFVLRVDGHLAFGSMARGICLWTVASVVLASKGTFVRRLLAEFDLLFVLTNTMHPKLSLLCSLYVQSKRLGR